MEKSLKMFLAPGLYKERLGAGLGSQAPWSPRTKLPVGA